MKKEYKCHFSRLKRIQFHDMYSFVHDIRYILYISTSSISMLQNNNNKTI